MKTNLSTSDIAALCGVKAGKIRVVTDTLGDLVQRVGPYRVIPRTALPAIMAELARRGWLPTEETSDEQAKANGSPVSVPAPAPSRRRARGRSGFDSVPAVAAGGVCVRDSGNAGGIPA